MVRTVSPVDDIDNAFDRWPQSDRTKNSTNQETFWSTKNMSTTPDQLLTTPSEESQKSASVVFEMPSSELKKSNNNYSTTNEKMLSDANQRGQFFSQPPWQKLLLIFLAELIGTAILMFFGCMGLVPSTQTGSLGQYSGALSFACSVSITIVIIGHISDCHLNPCVTLCAVLLGKISLVTSIVYVIAEFLGALLGYGLLVVVAPYNMLDGSFGEGICVTSPVAGLSVWQALSIESLATGCLILLVCSVWDPHNDNGDCGPLKFLVIIFLTSMVVGPFTGNSLNPVRTLAPAIYNNAWNMHWIYWAGPFSGTIASTLFYKYVFMALDSGEREK